MPLRQPSNGTSEENLAITGQVPARKDLTLFITGGNGAEPRPPNRNKLKWFIFLLNVLTSNG
jgi:hypothetical protein